MAKPASLHSWLLQPAPTISTGMQIKGKERKKKAQPLLLTPQSTTHMHTLFPPPLKFTGLVNSLGQKLHLGKSKVALRLLQTPAPVLALPVPPQPETNLFWKVESCPKKRDHTQSLSLQLLGAGSHTHTHTRTYTNTHMHTHKMAALTKISSTPSAPYELNYNLLRG